MDGAASPDDHVINSPTQVSTGFSSFSPNLDYYALNVQVGLKFKKENKI